MIESRSEDVNQRPGITLRYLSTFSFLHETSVTYNTSAYHV